MCISPTCFVCLQGPTGEVGSPGIQGEPGIAVSSILSPDQPGDLNFLYIKMRLIEDLKLYVI